MATREVLDKLIGSTPNIDYASLPPRVKAAVSFDEWRRHVIDHCIAHGLPWESPARTVCDERQYYESLLAVFRSEKRLYPYHLGEYVCRVLRVTPFAYYCDVLVDTMKEDSAYDVIPNFTAADIAGTVGIGRNEYIAIMQQAKSKMLWRVNKGLVRDLLPELPQNARPRQPWWRVCLVNLGEVEYRTMSSSEAEACRMAASHADGVPFSAINEAAATSLYARGLVWFNIPIDAGDHVAIPPLEGFVSNKTASISIDPLETLLYQIFVAASESVTVSELADILDTSVEKVKVGISMACRLGFCNKLTEVGGTTGAMASPPGARGVNQGDTREDASASASDAVPTPAPAPAPDKKSIAFVVDSAVTGFLMMGALNPEVKKHSVTLFEGGRVYGAGVIEELVRGLEASVDMSKDFEGEMLELGRTSRSMAAVLRCLQSTAASSIELLRKESFEQLADREQAERILVRSHDVLICATGLKGPALPLKDAASHGTGTGPTLFGPSPLCLTPWVNIALYRLSGDGPKSIVMPAGSMLETDELFQGAANVVVTNWSPDGAAPPRALDTRTALFRINKMLQTSAVMIQPLAAGKDDDREDREEQEGAWRAIDEPVFVPLPFRRSSDGSVDAFTSADGAKIVIEVGAAVESALEAMGLLEQVGTLSFLPPSARPSTPSPTPETDAMWVPLGVSIGIPLDPVALCEEVCGRLSQTGVAWLSPAALARQRENQAKLDRAVMEAKLDPSDGNEGGHGNGYGNGARDCMSRHWPTRKLAVVG